MGPHDLFSHESGIDAMASLQCSYLKMVNFSLITDSFSFSTILLLSRVRILKSSKGAK